MCDSDSLVRADHPIGVWELGHQAGGHCVVACVGRISLGFNYHGPLDTFLGCCCCLVGTREGQTTDRPDRETHGKGMASSVLLPPRSSRTIAIRHGLESING